MSSIPQSRGLRKLGRTVLQWAASIGTTGLTLVVAESVGVKFGPLAAVAFQAFWLFLYTYAQNTLETAGKIPVFLPAPGLVSQILTPVTGAVSDVTPIVAPTISATVDAVSDITGDVTGAVTDLTGGVIGAVKGKLPPKETPAL